MKVILILVGFILCTSLGINAQTNMELAEAKAYLNLRTSEGYKNAINIYSKYEVNLDGSQLNDFGYCYWSLKDYVPALKYFELSAAKGFDMGIFDAGFNYYFGNGTEKNYVKAYQYLIKLKPDFSEITAAQHYIGHCIEWDATINGIAGKPNYQLAYSYLLKAAEGGDLESMIHVAVYNNNSGKIAANYDLAKIWYTKACEANSKDACDALAKLNEILLKQPTDNSQQKTANTYQRATKNDYLSVLEAIKNSLKSGN